MLGAGAFAVYLQDGREDLLFTLCSDGCTHRQRVELNAKESEGSSRAFGLLWLDWHIARGACLGHCSQVLLACVGVGRAGCEEILKVVDNMPDLIIVLHDPL